MKNAFKETRASCPSALPWVQGSALCLASCVLPMHRRLIALIYLSVQLQEAKLAERFQGPQSLALVVSPNLKGMDAPMPVHFQVLCDPVWVQYPAAESWQRYH